MSVEQVSPLKSSFARPGLLALPRVSLFLSERLSSNDDNSTEVSSPLLPKNPWKDSKVGLSAKKSKFREIQAEQEDEREDQVEPLNMDLPNFAEESLKPFELSSPIGSSSCGDESPFQRGLRRTSPKRQREGDFSEAFYKRIEDFFDSEHLTICQPEDNRRSMFAHLRVSTARIKSLQNGDPNSANIPDLNSPSLISPSILTSTLFKRRSCSREPSAEKIAKENKILTKSPFCKYGKKAYDYDEGTPNRNIIKLDDDDNDDSTRESPRKKANNRLSNPKLQGLSITINRGRSDTIRPLDFDEEDANSPTKI